MKSLGIKNYIKAVTSLCLIGYYTLFELPEGFWEGAHRRVTWRLLQSTRKQLLLAPKTGDRGAWPKSVDKWLEGLGRNSGWKGLLHILSDSADCKQYFKNAVSWIAHAWNELPIERNMFLRLKPITPCRCAADLGTRWTERELEDFQTEEWHEGHDDASVRSIAIDAHTSKEDLRETVARARDSDSVYRFSFENGIPRIDKSTFIQIINSD